MVFGLPMRKGGKIAWKQGFMYKLWSAPFGQKITSTRKPIEGVPYYKGFKSATRSAVMKGEELPAVARRRMGIVNITALGANRKPELLFTRSGAARKKKWR